MKIIYLTSLHNSGSTVISLLANSHPEIVSPGELVGPGGRFHGSDGPQCSCGEVVGKCSFWMQVADRYIKKGYPWKPDAWELEYALNNYPILSKLIFSKISINTGKFYVHDFIPHVNKIIKDIGERFREFSNIVADVSGKQVILDASKHPKRLYFLSRIPGIDLSVIHLIRDPRGWCYSRKRGFMEDINKSAHRWVSENQFIANLTKNLPKEKTMTMLYEDFCHDPQGSMNRIYNLGGLPDSELPKDINTITHHLLGNRMRTRKDLKVSHDMSWKSSLNEKEISTIEDITRTAAIQYGYNF